MTSRCQWPTFILVLAAVGALLFFGFWKTQQKINNNSNSKNNRLTESFADSPAAANSDLIQTNPDIKGAPAAPWQRHPVNDSIPIDPQSKYKNAYYNELSNGDFQSALAMVFQMPCDEQKRTQAVVDATSDWDMGVLPPTNPFVEEAYNAAVKLISDRIETTPPPVALALPGDTNRIQMVHDRLESYKLGIKGRSSENKILMTIEFIFYRFSKYHGKHVKMLVLAEPKSDPNDLSPSDIMEWMISVVASRVEGIVYEDNIGLYPVVASVSGPSMATSTLQNVLRTNPDPKAMAEYPSVLMEENETMEIVKKQQSQGLAALEADGIIRGWLSPNAGNGETMGG